MNRLGLRSSCIRFAAPNLGHAVVFRKRFVEFTKIDWLQLSLGNHCEQTECSKAPLRPLPRMETSLEPSPGLNTKNRVGFEVISLATTAMEFPIDVRCANSIYCDRRTWAQTVMSDCQSR